MADAKEVASLKLSLSSPQLIEADQSGILRRICRLASSVEDTDDEQALQELILRAREYRDSFGGLIPILDSLVRRVGLFPYLADAELKTADRLAYEFHRPLNLDEDDVVLHSEQGHVYRELLDGNSVILSAPTSFGKSLVIDAMIASGKYRDVAVIVPTIALIDETRRRFSRFRKSYKIITHSAQSRSTQNVYVLTQERLLELTDDDIEKIDFFALDEFYKLNPAQDQDRSLLLNHALYRLLKNRTQFYMLGPNIEAVPPGFPERFQCTFIKTNYATVVSEMHNVDGTRSEEIARLIGLCKRLKDPTLIYCSSPARARKVVQELLAAGTSEGSPETGRAADWISNAYHPDWLFPRGLRAGIGMHHGRIPRALAHYCVKAFNDEKLKFLVCTSTLIEGVNTKAKNVIIFDKKMSTKNFDFFTFNNIKGRSGRMFQHFTGHAYLFHDPPNPDLPSIDIPMFTQGADTPESLLIQIDRADRSLDAQSRIDWIDKQSILSPKTLRANSGINPSDQIALAKAIIKKINHYHRALSWRVYPTYDQLKATCELIWDHLVQDKRLRSGVSSASQLTFKINQLRSAKSLSGYLREQVNSASEKDKAVEEVLDFVRYWAMHHFPKYLMALNRIQAEIFSTRNMKAGNLSTFAAEIEFLFVDPAIAALDEFGLPIQMAISLAPQLAPTDDLDGVLARLRLLDPKALQLSRFERDVLRDVQRGL